MVVAAVSIIALAHVVAQEQPAVSGTWNVAADPVPGIAAAPSPILGQRFALRQEGDRLAMIRTVRDEAIVTTLRLDGTRTTYRVPGRMCEGDTEFVETAAWEGGAITLTTVGRMPPGGEMIQLNVKRLLRLDGVDRLSVEGSMTQAGVTRVVATLYKRVDDPLARTRVGVKGPPARIGDVAWISGTWVGVNANVTSEERWTPPASGGMLATARTLRGNALVSFEFLCIAERDGTLVYTALPDGRTTPTKFTLTALQEGSATFENPTHDFPKMIVYKRRPDGTLETTISGANRPAQSFVHKRQE